MIYILVVIISPGLIQTLCNLGLLKNFYAFSNQITVIYLNVLVVYRIIHSSLFDNEINGNIPNSIGSLSKLTPDLSSNQLVSLPESIVKCFISYIHLNNNNLINLPESICDLEINWNFLVFQVFQ